MKKKWLFLCFFLLLVIPVRKANAAYSSIEQALGYTPQYYATMGVGGDYDTSNTKQEISSITFNGTMMNIRGVMMAVDSQNYYGGDENHSYYIGFEAGGRQLIYKGDIRGDSRTLTHSIKTNSNNPAGPLLGHAKCSDAQMKWHFNAGADDCDVYYDNVGFEFNIPLNEVMDFATDTDISIYLYVINKQERRDYGGPTHTVVYKDSMTTVLPTVYERAVGDYLVTLKTQVDHGQGKVIESNVITRNSVDNGNIIDPFCSPEAGCGDTLYRSFFAQGQIYSIVDGYCNGCYAGGTAQDHQGAYKVRVGGGSNWVVFPGNLHTVWIAASEVRVVGKADVFRIKPNKKLWVDQIVSPTQECDGNAKLLVKAHCDPCSKDGSDEITISWGEKTKTVKLKDLPKSEQEALNGDGYVIKFDATNCRYNEQKQVHITAGNDDNPAGKLNSTGYIPAKDHMEMSCTNEDKMTQKVSNVVLTSKFRTPSLNRPDDHSQPWLYNETIQIRTGESPGTINAGMGFEYPVAYTYTVDKEVEKYGKLFPSGSFGFDPKTKFYTTNLAQKLDEYPSYAKKDVTTDNPEKVANALKTIYSSKENPYTIPYKNSIPGKKDVVEEIDNAIVGKDPTSLSSTLFVADYNGDGIINILDSMFVQDLYSNSFVDGNTRYVLNSAQLPETYIEKGSGYVYAKKSQASVQPTEDGGNKMYTRLDTKQGDYYFSVSGQSIGLNQYSFVLPKCYYKVKCNPLAETCETGPKCPPGDPECPPGEPECPPDDPDCPSTGQAVFRIISLKTPFPGREPGRNWVGHTNLIRTDAYESSPEYSLDMNHTLLRRIQDYNSNYHYLNYNTFYRDSTSHIWRTSFIDKFGITRGV